MPTPPRAVDAECVIRPGDIPINLLGGYRWPGAQIDPDLAAQIMLVEVGRLPERITAAALSKPKDKDWT